MTAWNKAIAAVSISAAAAIGTVLTKDPNCLWALFIIVLIFNG